MVIVLFFLFLKDLFIWESEWVQVHEWEERQRERIPGRLPAECRAHDPRDHDLILTKGQPLNLLSHPGAPVLLFSLFGRNSGMILSQNITFSEQFQSSQRNSSNSSSLKYFLRFECIFIHNYLPSSYLHIGMSLPIAQKTRSILTWGRSTRSST